MQDQYKHWRWDFNQLQNRWIKNEGKRNGNLVKKSQYLSPDATVTDKVGKLTDSHVSRIPKLLAVRQRVHTRQTATLTMKKSARMKCSENKDQLSEKSDGYAKRSLQWHEESEEQLLSIFPTFVRTTADVGILPQLSSTYLLSMKQCRQISGRSRPLRDYRTRGSLQLCRIPNPRDLQWKTTPLIVWSPPVTMLTQFPFWEQWKFCSS